MKTLIEQALAIPYTEWAVIDTLIQQAPDQATADALADIQKSKYHTEESSLYY